MTSGPPSSAHLAGGAPLSPSENDVNSNPLLQPWVGPLGGVPPFEQVQVMHFEEALRVGMDAQRSELQAIVDCPQPPTFDNTLEALENSGRLLSAVRSVYGIWDSSRSSPEYQALARRVAPVLAAFDDEIFQNQGLFQRIDAVFSADSSKPTKLESAERSRLLHVVHTRFVLAGARLDTASKAELTQINQKLAGLFTQFGDNILHDEENDGLLLTSGEQLAGLSAEQVDAARSAAEQAGKSGQWLIANTRSAVEPFLTHCSNRSLRQQVWQRFVRRGDRDGEHNNCPLIAEIVALRARRARLLGFSTHAHWRLQTSMAKAPEATMSLMREVWHASTQRVAEEVEDMQTLADAEAQQLGTAPFAVEAWDYRYFAEKVRAAKYEFDESELQPYLQLHKLRDALFWVAEQLFSLQFERRHDIAGFHPDVEVWQVLRRQTPVGLWYFDPYARKGKRSGAWMCGIRDQETFSGSVLPIVSNNENFLAPAPGKPCLLTWDNATTLFHEFGHGLHGLLSAVQYPTLAGTSVARDFVEFPSQLLEHWLSSPEVLNRFAVHSETGEAMPPELLSKLQRASRFNQGFDTTEYLATALLDMQLHSDPEQETESLDARRFEAQALEALAMPKQVVMRHRLPHLSHVFSGDSYSAGYYSYLWADALTADAFEAFEQAGGAMNQPLAQLLEQTVLAVGNTVEPANAYEAFRGRSPQPHALMRKRGFA